jgi:hypothetical protein
MFWNHNYPMFCSMFENFMTPCLSNKTPTILFYKFNYLPCLHLPKVTFQLLLSKLNIFFRGGTMTIKILKQTAQTDNS